MTLDVPSFSSYYIPTNPKDATVLVGSSFDTKIGYNKRAAAQTDLYVILQDIEGTPLTDADGEDLVSQVTGFITSELTSENALGVNLPTIPEEKQTFYYTVFGDAFEVRKRQVGAGIGGGDILPYVKITNPSNAFKYIREKDVIEVATGDVSYKVDVNGLDAVGYEFENFVITSIEESFDANGNFIITYFLNAEPTNDAYGPSPARPVSMIRNKVVKTRVATLKVEEVFPSTSEVSTTLLGIDRAETQLGLFSNVSTYGFNPDEFVYYNDNPSLGPTSWVTRLTESGERHYSSRVEEVGNEGALRISSYPVPYSYPWPPLTQSFNADGNDIIGLFSQEGWRKWQNWVRLGKSLYEYFVILRDSQGTSNSPDSPRYKYNLVLSRFLPAINLWDDNEFYGGQYYGNDTDRYYLQISIWTDTWRKISDGEFIEPVTGQPMNLIWLKNNIAILRGTGTDPLINAGSYATGTPNNGASSPATYLNPFKETWKNDEFISAASSGGDPILLDFVPGYSASGNTYTLLQSRQAFRYQPGRISGYTFGTRATMTKDTANNFAEWGIFNDFDEYVFRREGANFFIVRRSNVHLPLSSLQELGVADVDGNVDPERVVYYDKTISGKIYTIQEISLPREKFNGDSLNGNGPSGYLLTTDEITMYKIEFGWYGAIGLRLYAYIPVENGKARWVVVHTFVIENKLQEPSMGDPFYRFKYEMRVGSQQGPRLDEPQVLYKYGTSMYIDGGDEGTVSVYSQVSDTKNLPFAVGGGNYTSIFGIYPKKSIVSGGVDNNGNNVSIPNKKIIIPKLVSITATGVDQNESNALAELNFTKCTACAGSSYLYMPDIRNGQHGDIRKVKKVDSTTGDSNLTLASIDKQVLAVELSGSRLVIQNPDYIRQGDYLTDLNHSGSIIPGHIRNLAFRGVIGTITNRGSNYTPGTYLDVALTNVSGSGTGLTATIQANDGVATGQGGTPVTTVGDGYTAGENYQDSINGLVIRADTVDGSGGILTYTIVDGGSGYTTGDVTLDLSPFGTIAAVVNITTTDGIVTSVLTGRTGTGYNVGDVLTATISGGTGFEYTVSAVDTWKISTVPGGSAQGSQPSTHTITAGDTVTIQPIWVTSDQQRKDYNLNYTDYKAKAIYTRMWNTYIGNSGSGQSFGDGYATIDLLGYVSSKRWDLDEERRLDPTKIVTNTSLGVGQTPIPADFFGDPTTETFDLRLSQSKISISGPNPLSGPTGIIRWLNPIRRESTGQLAEWTMGFTPYRPVYNQQTGELEKWVKPDGTDYTETREVYDELTDSIVTRSDVLALELPDAVTVTLDYHPYGIDVNNVGFETGEAWYSRIHPFRDDFRIGNPTGSNSGLCSNMRLQKQSTTIRTVEQVTSTDLSSITNNQWGDSFDNNDERLAYLSSSTYFLKTTGTTSIYIGTGNPSGGQIAVNPTGTDSYIKFFYDSNGQNGQLCRFAGPEKKYIETSQGVQTQYNVIPIKANDLSTDIDLKDARNLSGNNIIPVADSEFNIAYNGVELRAWFSGDDTNNTEDLRYDVPNSYTGGGNNQAVFDFDAFPLYAYAKLRDNAEIRSAELHDIDALDNLSTQQAQWKRTFIPSFNPSTGNTETVDSTTYGLGSNLRTGQLNVSGIGDITQSSNLASDDVVPAAFQQVSRLSSAQLDTQGASILRPGNRLTTLYINNETKTFDLDDVFGFDRKVITPDVVNTEAVFIVGRAIGNTSVDIQINITYVEQL